MNTTQDLQIPRHLNRLPQIQQKTGLGPTKLYELIKQGRFPPPVVLATTKSGVARTVAWPDNEVAEWVSAVVAGATADELRALVVRQLNARRTHATMLGLKHTECVAEQSAQPASIASRRKTSKRGRSTKRSRSLPVA